MTWKLSHPLQQVNAGLFWQDFPLGCYSSEQFCYDTNDTGSICPQLVPHTPGPCGKIGNISCPNQASVQLIFQAFFNLQRHFVKKRSCKQLFCSQVFNDTSSSGTGMWGCGFWYLKTSVHLDGFQVRFRTCLSVCVFTVLFMKPHYFLHNKVAKAGSQTHPLFPQI